MVSSCLSDFHHLFAFSFSINYSQRFCQSPGERGKLSDPLVFVFLLSTGHCLTINGTSCLTLPKRFKSTERFTLPPSLSCILYPSLSPWTECPRHLVNEGRAWGMHGILAVLPLPMTAQIVGLLFFCRSISIFCQLFTPAPVEMTEICQETVRFVWLSFDGGTHLHILLLLNLSLLNFFVCLGLNVKECLRLPVFMDAKKVAQIREI